jgi:hypothetical protein
MAAFFIGANLIIRKDNRATAVVPESITEAIQRVGGTNIYGEPLYRLVLAQDRYTLAAGEWNEWPEDASLDDISGLGIGEMREMVKEGKPEQEINEFLQSRLMIKPDSVTVGMKEIPVYGYEGWVLEKWKPASNYGFPSDWEQFKFHGEMALGPYPEFGDYEYCAGPTPYMLTESQIEDHIRFDMKQIDSKSSSPKQRVLLLLQRREIALAQKKRDRKSVIETVLKYGSLGNLRNRLSLGAGRIRQQLADQAGLKGHWGN